MKSAIRPGSIFNRQGGSVFGRRQQHTLGTIRLRKKVTMLVLVDAKGYLAQVLRNEAIAGYLKRHHADLLEELVSIMKSVSSDARHLERE